MLGSIGLLDFLSWWLLGLSPEAAILLRAVLAPTDPVLASEVQSLPPLTNETNEVRFALTSRSRLQRRPRLPFYQPGAVRGSGLSRIPGVVL
jgi:sodium/hydrogen antiporter